MVAVQPVAVWLLTNITTRGGETTPVTKIATAHGKPARTQAPTHGTMAGITTTAIGTTTVGVTRTAVGAAALQPSLPVAVVVALAPVVVVAAAVVAGLAEGAINKFFR